MALDLSKLSPEQVEKYIHLQAIRDKQINEGKRIEIIRQYYDGDHPVFLTQRQQEFLGGLATGEEADIEFKFHHNMVKVIVDMLKDRLQLQGFTVNGKSAAAIEDEDAGEDERAAALMWQWWSDWRMDAQQSRLYKRVIRDGLSYVMVDYDVENARPRATLHSLDDGESGICYHRDPEDPNRVLFASKFWWTWDNKERKTVYAEGEIRKYIRQNNMSDWQEIKDDPSEPWPIPWRDRQGKPLGVCVIEFQDPDGGLVDGIIGLQNALNKSWLDMIAAADMSGFPVLVFEYAEAASKPARKKDDKNLTGDDEFELGPGRFIELFGAKANRLEAAGLESMIATIWTIVEGMAVATRMPQHELKPNAGNFPSGEALKQAEVGLVTKAEERQVVFGQSWADVMEMARKVEATFGSARLTQGKTVNIGTIWREAGTRMEKTDAEVAAMHKELGVPDDAVFRKAGYKPEEIAEFKNQKRVEEAVKLAAVTDAVMKSQAAQADADAKAQAKQDQATPAAGGVVAGAKGPSGAVGVVVRPPTIGRSPTNGSAAG